MLLRRCHVEDAAHVAVHRRKSGRDVDVVVRDPGRRAGEEHHADGQQTATKLGGHSEALLDEAQGRIHIDERDNLAHRGRRRCRYGCDIGQHHERNLFGADEVPRPQGVVKLRRITRTELDVPRQVAGGELVHGRQHVIRADLAVGAPHSVERGHRQTQPRLHHAGVLDIATSGQSAGDIGPRGEERLRG